MLFDFERWTQELTVIPSLIGCAQVCVCALALMCVSVCICNINGDTIFTLDSFSKIFSSLAIPFPLSFLLFRFHTFPILFCHSSVVVDVTVAGAVDKRCPKIGYDHEPKSTTHSRIFLRRLLFFFLRRFLETVCVECATLLLFTFVVVSRISANSTCFQLLSPGPPLPVQHTTVGQQSLSTVRWCLGHERKRVRVCVHGFIFQLNRNQFLITYRGRETLCSAGAVVVLNHLHPNKRMEDWEKGKKKDSLCWINTHMLALAWILLLDWIETVVQN